MTRICRIFGGAVDEGRRHHPGVLKLGIPFRQGAVRSVDPLVVRTADDRPLASQWRALASWPDGSVRWGIVAADGFGSQDLFVSVAGEDRSLEAATDPHDFHRLEVEVAKEGLKLKHAGRSGILGVTARWNDCEFRFATDALTSLWDGPVLTEWLVDGKLVGETGQILGVLVQLYIDAWHESGLIECKLVVRNPEAAGHPNNNWDLGNQGSIYLQDLRLFLEQPGSQEARSPAISLQLEPNGRFVSGTQQATLFQASSGGDHWDSSNHIDRHRKVPMEFRGYRAIVDSETFTGNRATPIAIVRNSEQAIVAGVPRYWQNFPRSIRLQKNRIEIGFFPSECGYEHELQGGEQKTHVCLLAMADPTASTDVLEKRFRSCVRTLEPEYVSSTHVIPYLAPWSSRTYDEVQVAYENLARLAVEGSDTFEHKRELIDEYGWRNFGDIYGDHEAAFHKGETPLISHYNNQYDCVAAFAYQYLRTAEPIWHEYMIEMAEHAWDIDTYHTSKDHAKYNHGLFWHTYHYADADTGTHRSYPRSLVAKDHFESGKDLNKLGDTGKRLKRAYAKGGGPAASHNYSTGWVYAYYLTGDNRYRDAVIGAAEFVFAVEDGTKTPFRFLCTSATGSATCSSPGYHGPGRASANSTLALLAALELTGQQRYLDFAVKLMKRTVHPRQNLDKLDLLNAELRWFYTMYLQALVRLIAVLKQYPDRQSDLQYALATLMHYCRWMVDRERPILDHPERLQYPTETWAAQDMRKWHVLAEASLWCSDPSIAKSMTEKAEFIFRESIRRLETFETKSLCRPVILLLNYGWQRPALNAAKAEPIPITARDGDFPEPPEFRPQREIAVKRAKRIVMFSGASTALLIVLVALRWFFG